MTLGDRLRAARVGKGMSLRDVEKATGKAITNGYLSLLETGAVKAPSPRHLQQLAAVLDVPYAELMGLAGYLAPANNARRGVAGVAFSADEDLTSDERAQVESFIEFLRSKRSGPGR